MRDKISQTKIIYDILLDGEAHSTFELVNKIKPGGGLVRISERIREIKKQYGVDIISYRDDRDKTKWYYQMKPIRLEDMPEYDEYFRQNRLL